MARKLPNKTWLEEISAWDSRCFSSPVVKLWETPEDSGMNALWIFSSIQHPLGPKLVWFGGRKRQAGTMLACNTTSMKNWKWHDHVGVGGNTLGFRPILVNPSPKSPGGITFVSIEHTALETSCSLIRGCLNLDLPVFCNCLSWQPFCDWSSWQAFCGGDHH